MRLVPFSEKQKTALTWWCDRSPYEDREAIICDGAVRSGKTFCMGLSFFCWAMRRFNGEQFGLCGKTVASLRRNLLAGLTPVLKQLGFQCTELVSKSKLDVAFGGHKNTFYLFGGKDEGSAALIQGVTLAGALMDEVVLMPRSFVEQAAARCSVRGAKLWFSCNPEGPEHWFYKEWVQKAGERRALYLHFLMEDNPALDPQVIEGYAQRFSGAFYRRFVLGEWVAAEGRVYDFFDESYVQKAPEGAMERWRASCDYGTVNPTSMGLWGRLDGGWYRVREFYFDSRREKRQMTDREYADALRELAGGRELERVIVDPSAASFIEVLRRDGWRVEKADNDVLSGIRVVADLLRQGKLVICEGCGDAIREFGLYCWDQRAGGDRVIKKFDHAMDDIRYFAAGLERDDGFIGGGFVERDAW